MVIKLLSFPRERKRKFEVILYLHSHSMIVMSTLILLRGRTRLFSSLLFLADVAVSKEMDEIKIFASLR